MGSEEGDELRGDELGIGPPQDGVVGHMVSLFVEPLKSIAERPEEVGDIRVSVTSPPTPARPPAAPKLEGAPTGAVLSTGPVS